MCWWRVENDKWCGHLCGSQGHSRYKYKWNHPCFFFVIGWWRWCIFMICDATTKRTWFMFSCMHSFNIVSSIVIIISQSIYTMMFLFPFFWQSLGTSWLIGWYVNVPLKAVQFNHGKELILGREFPLSFSFYATMNYKPRNGLGVVGGDDDLTPSKLWR